MSHTLPSKSLEPADRRIELGIAVPSGEASWACHLWYVLLEHMPPRSKYQLLLKSSGQYRPPMASSLSRRQWGEVLAVEDGAAAAAAAATTTQAVARRAVSTVTRGCQVAGSYFLFGHVLFVAVSCFRMVRNHTRPASPWP